MIWNNHTFSTDNRINVSVRRTFFPVACKLRNINYTNQTISTFHINLHIKSTKLLSGLLHEKDMRDFKGHKVINGSSLGTWASIYPSPNNKIKPWINPVPYSLGNERAPCMIVSGYDQHRFPNMRLMIWTNVSNVIAERPLKAQQCWLHCWV